MWKRKTDPEMDMLEIKTQNIRIRPDPVASFNMAYAAAANKDKPSFYVAKGWHNRFAGPRGANLVEASQQFKVKIKMARREVHALHFYALIYVISFPLSPI